MTNLLKLFLGLPYSVERIQFKMFKIYIYIVLWLNLLMFNLSKGFVILNFLKLTFHRLSDNLNASMESRLVAIPRRNVPGIMKKKRMRIQDPTSTSSIISDGRPGKKRTCALFQEVESD